MSFPPVSGPDQVEFGGASYCSTGTMSTPTGSPHVKAIEFRLPRFTTSPTVSVQLIGDVGAAPIAAYALKINDNVGGMTQIVVEAQTLYRDSAGAPVPAVGVHHCNIVVIVPA